MTAEATIVWNRAATKSRSASDRDGDLALRAILLAHGLVMNGGVLHALDGLDESELHAARDEADASGEVEERLNATYWTELPDDGAIMTRFFQHFTEHAEQYFPSSN